MKHFYLLTFSLFLIVSLDAQPQIYWGDNPFNLQQDSIHCFRYVDSTQRWQSHFKNYFFWNSGFYLDSIRRIDWNASEQMWTSSARYFYTYNHNSWDTIMTLTEVWRPALEAWVFTEQVQYEYSEDGLQIDKILSTQYSSPSWTNSLKSVLSSDSSGKLLNMKYYVWDDNFMQWEIWNKDTLIYDSLSRHVFTQYYKWAGEWILQNDKQITWGENDLVSEELILSFEYNQQLSMQRRFESSYDSLQRLTTYKSYTWTSDDPVWQPEYRYYYVLDISGRFFQYGLDRWNKLLGRWTSLSYCDIWGELLLTNNHPPEEFSQQDEFTCAFPNPYETGSLIVCDQFIKGMSYDLSLWDLHGRLIQQTTFLGDQSPSLDKTIAGGLYLLRIQDHRNHLLMHQKILIHQ